MDCSSTALQRQRSCACRTLDVGNWCNSGRPRTAGTFADDYVDELDPFSDWRAQSPSSAGTRLRGLWRKIMKEKRRILSTASPATTHVPYDPYTYAQNFDEGSASVEPDNLSRTFSARFAVPSTMMQRVG